MNKNTLSKKQASWIVAAVAFGCIIVLGIFTFGCSASSGGGSVTTSPSTISSPEPISDAPALQQTPATDQPEQTEKPPVPEQPGQDNPQVPLAETNSVRAAALVAEMTTEEKVAQLFITTPDDLTGYGQVVEAGDVTRAALEQYPVGGLIYFGINLESSEQTRTMLANTQTFAKNASGLPLFLCVDEEGGTVSRIGGTPGFDIDNVGDMRDIGTSSTPDEARRLATHMGTYLKELGFNTDFAPVADIDNAGSETMAQRVFGSDAQVVASFVGAQVEGFSAADMLSCAKHFPGIGGAFGDSHEGSIATNKTIAEMAEEELVPFRYAIDAGVPFVMVGHLSTPNASSEGLPASLSHDIITGLLRNDLGFSGLIITDSLSMGAVSEGLTIGQASVLAFNAGADMLLMDYGFHDSYPAVLAAVQSGEISQQRLDESVERIIQTKLTFLD